MKKFIKKKPVAITVCVLAILMLAFYMYMIIRPVAVGMSYKGELNLGIKKVEATYKINGFSKLTQITENAEIEYSYFVKGREIVVFLGHDGEMNKEDYQDMKERVLKNWEYYKKLGWVNSVNAFTMEKGGENFISTSSIVFAVVGGIVTLTLIIMAGMAIAPSKKKSKKKRK